jgi:hypothetical protein
MSIITMEKKLNWAKLIVLIFACLLVIPMIILIISAIIYQSSFEGSVFHYTILGKLTQIWE